MEFCDTADYKSALLLRHRTYAMEHLGLGRSRSAFIPLLVCSLFVSFSFVSQAALGPGDILIADFEGEDYGKWKVEGTAFGTGPAHGTLPGQMVVEGFLGKGLVNSFLGGDDSIGRLTSPPFKIERRYLTFLIGGGGWPETCMNLLVNGKIVRTATGPNILPGGSELLEVKSWDVAEFSGSEAVIEIVDQRKGGWGHINVDQIVQSDKKPPEIPENSKREIIAEKSLLNFPIKTGARKRNVTVSVDGKPLRYFEIELANGEPDWWAPLDISKWDGRKLTIQVDKLPEDSRGLSQLAETDSLMGGDNLYGEALRAQFHFSPMRGWNNDPNGLVYSQGEYHMYFQQNPYGWSWGNMHWGHAVSRDLVHWKELPIAIYPHGPGDAVFSGSAVVDKHNTSGWKHGRNDLLVAAFTSTGRGECIVYSNDRGRTWTEFEGNPVVKHSGRDPRLLWYQPTKHWVMALYDEKDNKRWIAFYTSPDLHKWEFSSRVEGFYECPDIFQLPVDDESKNKKWVLTAASSEYMVGSFDGMTFTPETPKLPGHRGKGFYAAQTFSNEPKGRVVRIGWLQTETPGMPFNQAMSLPIDLTLHETHEGPRLLWEPVRELESIRGDRVGQFSGEIAADTNPVKGAAGQLLEIRAEFEPREALQIDFNVRGVLVSYDVRNQEVVIKDHRAPAPMVQGKCRLTIYLDRTCLEVFAADGLTYMPFPIKVDPNNYSVSVLARAGFAKFDSLQVYQLKPIWPNTP
jgi:fructan beta-fructosidase